MRPAACKGAAWGAGVLAAAAIAWATLLAYVKPANVLSLLQLMSFCR